MNAPLSPLEIFRAKGIPNRRMEDWKYTDLRQFLDAETASLQFCGGFFLTATRPQRVEQIFHSRDELPDWSISTFETGSTHSVMEAAARANGPMAAFRVPAGVHVSETLDVEFGGDGHGAIVLVLEHGASLTLFERQLADCKVLRNIAFVIRLEQGASLTHVREACYAPDLVMVSTVSVIQERNSKYRVRLAQGGAKLSRAEWHVLLKGEGAETDLSGVSLLNDGAHADITTHIDHAVGKTTSRQLFKTVAAGHSRAIYQGKITVRPGANGSDSRQTAKALLLGARAEADLKPELEILADDVKCAHGAAVGDLDADSLFYLRSRGIPEGEARTLLVKAFLGEAVDAIEDEALRAAVWQFVEHGLAEAAKDQP